MSKHVPRVKIIDMLECIEKISAYTDEMTFDQFIVDGKTRDAAIWNIHILGEAANGIPKEFRSKHDHVPWSKLIRSRNVLSHEYDAIDFTIIWKIARVHCPELKQSLEKILSTLES